MSNDVRQLPLFEMFWNRLEGDYGWSLTLWCIWYNGHSEILQIYDVYGG